MEEAFDKKRKYQRSFVRGSSVRTMAFKEKDLSGKIVETAWKQLV